MAGFLIFLRFCQQRLSRFFAAALVFALSMMLLSCGGGSAGGASGPVADAIWPGSPMPVVVLPEISLLAGALGGSGNANGTGTGGRFNTPVGIAVDSTGNFYVADSEDHVIRKITSAGVITTFAGTSGKSGFINDTGSLARFNKPQGVALDTADNVYVADSDNNAIRKISPAGVVTTLAGGTQGELDGTGSAAQFNGPVGLVVDPAGNVYVTDTGNHTVRQITPGGVVSTLAGFNGEASFINGRGSVARFNTPVGIAIDNSTGNLYVADAVNQVIRQIIMPTADVSTFAGAPNDAGSADGVAAVARFNTPVGIAIDNSTHGFYVTEFVNQTVRVIASSGAVSTLAGSAGITGAVDNATGSAARFNLPVGVALDAAGNVYVADSSNHAIRKVSAAGAVTTFAGLMAATGSVDGSGGVARFTAPAGITVDQDGTITVADASNHTIRSITMAGAVTTLAGGAGVPGVLDGAALLSRFNTPLGVASDAAGNHYVVDTGNHTVRKISPAGEVTTLAGKAGEKGVADGAGDVARFSSISGIAVDTAGFVYVSDFESHTIRKITPEGVVSTLAGLAGTSGSTDGTGSVARFNSPIGLAVGLTGTLYVADTGNHTIRMITPDGVVSTLAGTTGVAGVLDATGAAARFNGPIGLAVDADDNLYVADTGNSTLRMITPARVVTTLAGIAGSNGVALGSLPGGLNAPTGVAIGLDGNLYVSSENAILKVTLSSPINRFGVSLQASSTSIFLDQSFSLHWAATNASSCVASGDGGDWSGVSAVSGKVIITPSIAGTVKYDLECTELGTGALKKAATVSVVTVTPVPTVSITPSSTQLTLGGSLTLNWSSTHATACVASANPASTDWVGAKAVSGSLTFTPTLGTRVYSLACTGDGGTGTKSVTVAVTVLPSATLSTSATNITVGQSVTLTWSSVNATSCSSLGAWSGARPLNGSLLVTPAVGTQAYGLICSGAGGTDSKSVVITVAPVPAPAPSSSGGLFDMDALLGLGALAMLRRYFSRREGQAGK